VLAHASDDRRDDPLVSNAKPPDRGTRMTKVVSRAAAGSFPMILLPAALPTMWPIGGLLVKGGYGSTAYQLPVSTVQEQAEVRRGAHAAAHDRGR
jgi:hypothetical protein